MWCSLSCWGSPSGAVIRRVVPAMAVTLLVLLVTAFSAQSWVRPHLFAPAEIRYPTYTFYADEPPDRIAAERGWLLSSKTVDGDGTVLSPAGELSDQRAAEHCDTTMAELVGEEGKRLLDTCGERLGLVDVAEVHPASRFWALQAAEAALFLGLAAALGGFSFWWVRRASG